jgi:hypothetical protein
MRLDPSGIRREISFPGMEPIYTWDCPAPGCNAGLFRPQAATTPAAIAAAPLCGHCQAEADARPAITEEQLPLFGETT